MRYYISDLHFYHDSLNHQMDCRGFKDSAEMNAFMIEQWNSRVTDKDEVVILGDLSVAKAPATNEIIHQLKGKLMLIEGNHDFRFLRDKKLDTSRFTWIRPYAEMYDNKRKVILSHYPIMCYNGQYQMTKKGQPRSYMLYGHVHDTCDEQLINHFQNITRQTTRMMKGINEERNIPCHMINCFCKYSNYVPLSLDEWIELDEKRRSQMKSTLNLPNVLPPEGTLDEATVEALQEKLLTSQEEECSGEDAPEEAEEMPKLAPQDMEE